MLFIYFLYHSVIFYYFCSFLFFFICENITTVLGIQHRRARRCNRQAEGRIRPESRGTIVVTGPRVGEEKPASQIQSGRGGGDWRRLRSARGIGPHYLRAGDGLPRSKPELPFLKNHLRHPENLKISRKYLISRRKSSTLTSTK